MDIKKIKKLIDLLENSSLSEIEITEGEESVRLSRQNHAPMTASLAQHHHVISPPVHHAPIHTEVKSTPSAEEPPISGHIIRSPMVGTFYTSASPETPAFVQIGQMVNAGQVLCIIEAMKMFNEIESDRAGKVIEVLVNNGEPVEYDQPLFVIE
jgi:acetyl-CoA carboxylase biotin carboxyl carrier protein